MSDLEKPLRPKKPKTWVDWAVQFRWILVIFVVLPFSRLFDWVAYFGDIWSSSKSEKRRQKEHDENVEKVIKRLKSRDPARDGLVCTARKPWIAVGMRNVDYKRARHFEVELSAFRQAADIVLEEAREPWPSSHRVCRSRGRSPRETRTYTRKATVRVPPLTRKAVFPRFLIRGTQREHRDSPPCALRKSHKVRVPSPEGTAELVLNMVLEIDAENKIARCEPLVNMGQITRMTVPMGLALAVVAELDDLTVGGLINGYGIEGSSHIYGLFSDTVVAYEIVLADGRLVRATCDNEYSDLFYAIPWSQGTLGLLVAAEIKLIDVKPYMKVTYQPVRGTLQDIAQAYNDTYMPRDGDQENPEKVPEFVEGMVYSETEAVCMTGQYATKEEAKKKGNKINEVGWWFKPWFYQHAQTALDRGEFVEYIPTRQYYHRHTRCVYWEGKLILPFGDQFWFRYLFGWMMPPKVSLLKATQGDAIRNYYHERHIIQDMLVPSYRVGDALEFSEREFEVYPIWLCPHRLFKTPIKAMITPEPGFEYAGRPGDTPYAQMYTDVGVYYTPRPVFRGEEYDGAAAVKKMEAWMIENHCYQPQYAVSELSEREFWRMFDASLYQRCRDKYKAMGTFMSVYYKSKKGRKTEKEVAEEEAKVSENGYSDIEKPETE